MMSCVVEIPHDQPGGIMMGGVGGQGGVVKGMIDGGKEKWNLNMEN